MKFIIHSTSSNYLSVGNGNIFFDEFEIGLKLISRFFLVGGQILIHDHRSGRQKNLLKILLFHSRVYGNFVRAKGLFIQFEKLRKLRIDENSFGLYRFQCLLPYAFYNFRSVESNHFRGWYFGS